MLCRGNHKIRLVAGTFFQTS